MRFLPRFTSKKKAKHIRSITNPKTSQYPDFVIIQASDFFDEEWYLKQYPDVASSGMPPAQHYLKIGADKNYDPSMHFSTLTYKERYSDVGEENPLLHFERVGRSEGRNSSDKTGNETQLGNQHITYISGESKTPGHNYRVVHYANALRALGYSVTIVAVEEVLDHIDVIKQSQLVIMWRVAWVDELHKVVAAIRSAGGKILFDIDDLMINPDLAKAEIIDGIRSTDSEEDKVNHLFSLIKDTMLRSDYCSAPTQFLTDYYARYGKRSFLLPNGFDEKVWRTARLALRKRQNENSDGLIRIGYAGGSRTHQKDFSLVADVLARVLEEYPQCRLVLFSKDKSSLINIDEYPCLSDVINQIEWREMVAYAKLPTEMARFDINLAPLEWGTDFCESKSELKFFESALVEVPAIASPTQVFADAIEHGVTGYLAADESDWYNCLKELIEDGALRKRVGRSAYHSVLWKYGYDQRMRAISSVVDMVVQAPRQAAQAFELSQLRNKQLKKDINISEHQIMYVNDKLQPSEVTVIVSAYNYANYILDALESVRAQTLENIDLIVVDDCSQDDTRSICLNWMRKYVDRFNRVALIKNDFNSGLSTTRNNGFYNVETPFVVPLDADNKLSAHFCEKTLIAIQDSNAAFAYASIQNFGANDDIKPAREFDVSLLTTGNYIDAMALVRVSVWAEVGGYSSAYRLGWEDYDFWCRIVERGHYGKHVSEVLASYRVHSASMLHTKSDLPENKIALINQIQRGHEWVKVDFQLPNRQSVKTLNADNSEGKLLVDSEHDVTLPVNTNNDINYLVCENEKIKKKINDLEWSIEHFKKHYSDTTTYLADWVGCHGGSAKDTVGNELVSIIMPTFNRAFMLRRAIDSVLAQHYQDWELLIIDDGSSDDTANVLNEYIKIDQRIKYFNIQHGGVAKARNKGLNEASGNIIAYLDSDVTWYQHYLSTIVKEYEDDGVSSVYLAQSRLDHSKNIHFINAVNFNLDELLKGNSIDMNVYSHRRELYDELGGFDEHLTRLCDWDFILKYSKKYPPRHVREIGSSYIPGDWPRISNTECYVSNFNYIRRKHLPKIKQRIKVLYVVCDSPQITETYIETEVKYMVYRGFDVTIYSMNTEIGCRFESVVETNYGDLNELIQKVQPDVIHMHWITIVKMNWPVLQNHNIPITVRGHGFDITQEEITDILEFEQLKKVYVFPQQHKCLIASRPDVLVVNNPPFDPLLYHPANHLNKDKRLVIRASSGMVIERDLLAYLDMAKMCPEFRFVLIVGTVSTKQAQVDCLVEENIKRGNPVEIRHNVPHAETAKMIGEAAIYLHTANPEYKQNRFYGMPISIAEAMASGCYIVSRNILALRNYVNGCGKHYDSYQEATDIINATLQFTDEDWTVVAQKSVQNAYETYVDCVALTRIVNDWIELAQADHNEVIESVAVAS